MTMAAPKYGQAHRSVRAQLMSVLKPGTPCEQVVRGKRCGLPMWPGVHPLDLGHAPGGGYIGIVHASCNRAAGQAASAASRGRTCKGCRRKYMPSLKRQKYCPACRALTTMAPERSAGRAW